MIAREGLPFILVGLALTSAMVLVAARFDSRTFFILGILGAILTVFCTFFFRDPPRHADIQPGDVLAPADGRIVGIEMLPSSDKGAERLRISIFLSVFDVHINRSPVAGTVKEINYRPGKFLAAFKPAASDVNEQNTMVLAVQGQPDIEVSQIAGLIARRIVCRAEPGDYLEAGERFGMIRFGSRADLLLPADCEVLVESGWHVKAGETVLARLTPTSEIHEQNTQAGEADAGL